MRTTSFRGTKWCLCNTCQGKVDLPCQEKHLATRFAQFCKTKEKTWKDVWGLCPLKGPTVVYALPSRLVTKENAPYEEKDLIDLYISTKLKKRLGKIYVHFHIRSPNLVTFLRVRNLTKGVVDIGDFPKWKRNSLNSANSGNLTNHWSMNWAPFKDPVSNMCLAGVVVASWSLTQEVAGLQVRALLL